MNLRQKGGRGGRANAKVERVVKGGVAGGWWRKLGTRWETKTRRLYYRSEFLSFSYPSLSDIQLRDLHRSLPQPQQILGSLPKQVSPPPRSPTALCRASP